MWTIRTRTCLMALAALGALLSLRAAAADGQAELEAKLAIADRLAHYAYRWDGKESAEFAALFTADAVMERWREGNLVEGSRISGREAILAYAESSHGGRLADRQTRHHFSNLVFLELSTDSAVTENMALITHQRAEDAAARISGSGIYRIRWEKSAGAWKIASRTLFSDSFPGQ